VIFFSGIGGYDMGVKEAEEKYGTAFYIALAIDYDESNTVNDIYSSLGCQL